MDGKVRFRLKREIGFAGYALTNFLCVNGEPVCALENGDSADVAVDRAPVYFIYDANSIEYNCILPHSSDFYEIEFRRTGWRDRDENGVFYLHENGVETQLSPFRMEKVREAMTIRHTFHSLREPEQTLVRVLQFRNAVREGADLVLSDRKSEEMLRAVVRVGAKQYARVFAELLGTLFAGESLPLDVYPLEVREDPYVREAVERVRQVEKDDDAEGELNRCIAKFILEQCLGEAPF